MDKVLKKLKKEYEGFEFRYFDPATINRILSWSVATNSGCRLSKK